MKTLEIEWKHLEKAGETCARCIDTGKALRQVVAELAKECRPAGWEIQFKETKLTLGEISESNMILLNGEPLEEILPNAAAGESHCQSCCDLTGNSLTCCRTIEFNGKSYEAIPADLIRRSVCAVAQCC